MNTSIHVGNENLKMVCGIEKNGAINIDTFTSVQLPLGAVLNGVITDPVLLGNAFREILTFHPDLDKQDLSVTIGGGQILSRTAMIPKISDKKILSWIEGEFTDTIEVGGEYLYDYRIIHEDESGRKALLCAASREMIGAYVEMFEELGIAIQSIDSDLNSNIKMVEFLPETKEKTFILISLDGQNMYASLFQDGLFQVANGMRLINERSTEGVSGEVGRMISNLLQFAHAEKFRKEIENIYVCGCKDDEVYILNDIMANFNIRPKILAAREDLINAGQNFRLDEYLYAVGNLL